MNIIKFDIALHYCKSQIENMIPVAYTQWPQLISNHKMWNQQPFDIEK